MENPSALVALLEKAYQDAKQSGVQDIHATLLAGLCWKTHYWIDRALDWIEQGAEIDEQIVTQLEKISSNQCHPQKTRHNASKYAKRWRHANSV